ncbi:hypothetical protein RJ640_014779, partial [Escallonia rubra]
PHPQTIKVGKLQLFAKDLNKHSKFCLRKREMEAIEHKTVTVNGINMHVAELGQGPVVLFLHGFPELWYTWRHQMVYMAAHGYRAVAPDLRGFGDTAVGPTGDAAKFTTLHVVGDIVALIDAVAPPDQDGKVFVVAHDWGALVAWALCLYRPEKVKGLVNMSVVFTPRNPKIAPLDQLRAVYGEDYYICRFQEPGEIEAEFAQMGTKMVLEKFLTYRTPGPLYLPKGKGFGDSSEPVVLPSWLSEADVDYYTSKYEQTGFTGGLNYYRALNLNWELTAAWTGAQVKVPVKFIVGELDLTYNGPGTKDYIHKGGFRKDVPLLQDVVVMEGNPRSQAVTVQKKYTESSQFEDADIVESEKAVVAADDGRCSEVGASVLRRGGHAVDAAVATALCLGIVNPMASGIGGGGFMIVRSSATSQTQAFDTRESAPLAATEHNTVTLHTGITMHVAEKGEGPLILFLHGFPELWYSWRHQMLHAAASGYRAVAPDLRGYGDTAGAPVGDAAKFTTLHVVGDLIALLDTVAGKEERVFVVGHDWGAYMAWHLCLYRPDRVKAVVNLSVPFFPRNPGTKMVEGIRAAYGDDHYICRFQEPGDIEAVFAQTDAKTVLRKFLTFRDPCPFYFPKGKACGDLFDAPIILPSWLSEEDLDYYAGKFEHTGFTGGVNYYRAFDLNWELNAPWTGAQVKVPAKFVVGDLDLVYHMPGTMEYIHKGGFQRDVPLLEEVVVLEDLVTGREMEGIDHKMVSVNGIDMHIAEKGQGPLVLFLHGFPELWYSWRHQIVYMAAHGYRAVAPDMRGYGDTTGAPLGDVTKFTTLHLVGDMIALIDAIAPDEDKVFVVGHDWGAYVAWHLCLFRPDRVKALVNLSVTYMPRNPTSSPAQTFRALYGDDHYISRFQEPGEIEAELAPLGTEIIVKKFLTFRTPGPLYFPKGRGFGDSPDTPIVLPSWLSQQDVDYFTSKFEKTGFTGGVNYYRALDLSWELTAAWTGAQVRVPTKFIIGDLDLTYHIPGAKEYIHNGRFQKDVPLLEEVVVMEGVAHFINQEKPDEINQHIHDFIKKIQNIFPSSHILNHNTSVESHSTAFKPILHLPLCMDTIQHNTVTLHTGITMHVAEKGEGGPLILFVHGFPELWYSWRHQMLHAAASGYRAVAPDLRGYGDTAGAPVGDAAKFTTLHLVGDLIALLDAVAGKEEKVFVVGHDWGAIIAWHLCLYRPDRVKALVNLSVPFFPRNPGKKMVEGIRAAYGDDHYICRFQVIQFMLFALNLTPISCQVFEVLKVDISLQIQPLLDDEPGDIEAVFAQTDVKTVLRRFLTYRDPSPFYFPKGKACGDLFDAPIILPSWLSEEDLDYYAGKFEHTGFTGGLNYYRATDLNWELNAPWTGAQVKVPAKFIVGDLDLVYNMPGTKEYIHNGGFHRNVPLLDEVVVLEDAYALDSWYSWRHQIVYMAAHGYRAVAPDMWGYGDTTRAPLGDITKFTTLHLVGDVVALIDAVAPDEDKVFVVGRDWGVRIAWHLCLFRPDRVKALVNLSVAYMPRDPTSSPARIFRALYGDDHYISRFQEPGEIEAELAPLGTERVVKKFLTFRTPGPLYFPKGKGFGDSPDTPIVLPSWLSQQDVNYHYLQKLGTECSLDWSSRDEVGIMFQRLHVDAKDMITTCERENREREMEGIEHKMVRVNGLDMHVAEKGQGPLVLFLHGFPELWYSWRHQIVYMAAHGYRAVAPDMRGYGDTTGAPLGDITKFTTLHLAGDMVALIDALAPGEDKVFVVGHDWGALVAWQLCLCRPDRVKALVNLSVMYMPRDPTRSLAQTFRDLYGDDHYISRFQEPGDIEAELAPLGTKRVVKKFLTKRTPGPLYFPKGKGFGDSPDTPIILPSWLSEEDVDYFTSKFEKTGFTGGVNYYRALDLSWELTAPWTGAKVTVPTKFIVGDLDLVYHITGAQEYIHNGAFHKDVPLLEEVVVMEGVAHFINQEKPDEISKHIHDFLRKF